jgi:hypothetical protein
MLSLNSIFRALSNQSNGIEDNIELKNFVEEKNVRSIRPGFGLHPKYT